MSLRDWMGGATEEQHIAIPEPPSAAGRPRRRMAEDRRRRREGDDLGPTLLFLEATDPVRLEVERYKSVEAWQTSEAPATEGVAVLFTSLPAEAARRLHEGGACLGCFPWPFGPYHDLRDDLPRRLGLFVYDASDEGFAPPYDRATPPSRPVHLDELPPAVREAIGRLRFGDVRFAERERIQPADHAPSDAWGIAYLDVDGRTVRPIPGREDQYRELFDEAASMPEYRFEPLPSPRRRGRRPT